MAAASTGGGSSSAVRAGRAFVEIYGDDTALFKGLDKMKAKFQAWGKSLMTGGGIATALSGAALTPFIGSLRSLLNRNTDLGELAAKLGVSAEKMSSFAYASDVAGVRLEDMAGHFENLTERVNQAALGTGEAAQAFKALGINPKDLLPLDEIDRLLTIMKALEKTPQGLRLGIMSSLGGDQFQKLNSIINTIGTGGFEKLMGKAGKFGAVVSAEDIANTMTMNFALTNLQTAAMNAFRSLGGVFLPLSDSLVQISKAFARVAAGVTAFVKENATAAQIIGGAVVGTLALGAALTAVGLTLTVAAPAIAILKIGLLALVSPIGLIVAGAVAIGAAFIATSDTFKAAWEGIKGAVMSGDLVLAFDIACAGIELVWAKMIQRIGDAWTKFKQALAIDEIRSSISQGIADIMGPDVRKALDENNRELAAQKVRPIPGLQTGVDAANDRLNELVKRGVAAGGAGAAPKRDADGQMKVIAAASQLANRVAEVNGAFGRSFDSRNALGNGKETENISKFTERSAKANEEVAKILKEKGVLAWGD